MLILNRRPEESIKVGDDVTVTVLEVNGIQVRFGIHAPRDMPVHREEIFKRILKTHGRNFPLGSYQDQPAALSSDEDNT